MAQSYEEQLRRRQIFSGIALGVIAATGVTADLIFEGGVTDAALGGLESAADSVYEARGVIGSVALHIVGFLAAVYAVALITDAARMALRLRNDTDNMLWPRNGDN